VGVLFPFADDERLAHGLIHLANLDDEQRQACAELMLLRLQERFSDQAVRDVFWRLPQVTSLIAES